MKSEQLVGACLERIAEREREVHAWAYLDTERALAEARERDREAPRSALHGVPVGIKDVIDTAGMPTEYNSPIYRGHQPKWDAACVTLLRRAGCVILGKTVTTEFANNHPAQTRNPHNLGHTPGGSSSGSAAAVADRMVTLALGTQTGGSVIRPGAYCGVAACKPSFGSINRAGLKFVSESLDTIGVFARTVQELAPLLQVLTGRSLSPEQNSKPRVGFCRTPHWRDADGEMQANLQRAAEQLGRAGAKVVDFELPKGSDAMFDRHSSVMGYESARALAYEYTNFPEQISDNLRPRLEKGWKVTRQDYDEVRGIARDCRRRLADQLREVDFLLTPSAASAAPASLVSTGDPVFNRAWTLFGVPCVTVPHGKGAHGLPLGVQLVGPFDGDMALIAWAHWVEGVLR
ncbi:MAG TPA: amidase [Burkholderiales bacterium]|nr:amidase [Burkholderiales bacterium]